MRFSRRKLMVGALTASTGTLTCATGTAQDRRARRARDVAQGMIINLHQDTNRVAFPKFEVQYDYLKHSPYNSEARPEEGGTLRYSDRVLVGVAIRCDEGDIDSLVVGGREVDPDDGVLKGYKEIQDLGDNVDVEIDGDDGQHIIWGLWARAHYGTVRNIYLYYREINSDGTLGELGSKPVMYEQGASLYDPNHPKDGLEAKALLPKGFVVTYIGVGLKAKESQKMKDLWADLAYIEPSR